MRTWAMLLFLKISMSVQLLWELHALFSEGVYTTLALIGPNKVACAPGVV